MVPLRNRQPVCLLSVVSLAYALALVDVHENIWSLINRHYPEQGSLFYMQIFILVFQSSNGEKNTPRLNLLGVW